MSPLQIHTFAGNSALSANDDLHKNIMVVLCNAEAIRQPQTEPIALDAIAQLAATGKDRTSSWDWADCLDRLAPRRMSMASIICALFSGSCSASTLQSNHSQKPGRVFGVQTY